MTIDIDTHAQDIVEEYNTREYAVVQRMTQCGPFIYFYIKTDGTREDYRQLTQTLDGDVRLVWLENRESPLSHWMIWVYGVDLVAAEIELHAEAVAQHERDERVLQLEEARDHLLSAIGLIQQATQGTEEQGRARAYILPTLEMCASQNHHYLGSQECNIDELIQALS